MPESNNSIPPDFSKDALNHAWNWFALHAAQRMQSFNFFLIATAFLVAGYAQVIERHQGAAVTIGLFGAWVSLWFNRLEKRTKQLVKAGEEALKPSQRALAKEVRISSLEILAAVEPKADGASSYANVISVMQWSTFAVFLGGAVYAAWPAITTYVSPACR